MKIWQILRWRLKKYENMADFDKAMEFLMFYKMSYFFHLLLRFHPYIYNYNTEAFNLRSVDARASYLVDAGTIFGRNERVKYRPGVQLKDRTLKAPPGLHRPSTWTIL